MSLVDTAIQNGNWYAITLAEKITLYMQDIFNGDSYFVQGNHGEIHILEKAWIIDKNTGHKIIPFREVGDKLKATLSHTRHLEFLEGYNQLVANGLTEYPVTFTNV
jgi:hypothetical protein